MSTATRRGAREKAWQYHSRSDTHSKVACWTVIFDLLNECDALRAQAEAGRIGFGINHVMVGPINKTLDLVVTHVPRTRKGIERVSFADLIQRYGICLDAEDRVMMDALVSIESETRTDISEVTIALEAKACMTEHLKSIPRLHAEILATGYLAKRAAPGCLAVSYSLVNAADSFVSPGARREVNRHNQPDDAARVVRMLGTAVPLVRDVKEFGYDAIGITVIDCANDGTPVTLRTKNPAPAITDHYHYEQMIRSLCAQYRRRFPDG